MQTIQRQEEIGSFIQLTVPPALARTNKPQSKAYRRRTRRGLPSLHDMARATAILARLRTADGVTELSRPENIETLRWANATVNYDQ